MLRSVQLFKALADETRLRILNLLTHGELCVCEIEQALEIGQSKASRHLAYLRNAGLVTDRREGPWMYYAVADPDGLAHRFVLKWLAQANGEIPQAAADLKALEELRQREEVCGQCTADGREQRVSSFPSHALTRKRGTSLSPFIIGNSRFASDRRLSRADRQPAHQSSRLPWCVWKILGPTRSQLAASSLWDRGR